MVRLKTQNRAEHIYIYIHTTTFTSVQKYIPRASTFPLIYGANWNTHPQPHTHTHTLTVYWVPPYCKAHLPLKIVNVSDPPFLSDHFPWQLTPHQLLCWTSLKSSHCSHTTHTYTWKSTATETCFECYSHSTFQIVPKCSLWILRLSNQRCYLVVKLCLCGGMKWKQGLVCKHKLCIFLLTNFNLSSCCKMHVFSILRGNQNIFKLQLF